MSRYTNKRKIVNASEYYAPLRRSRGLRAIVQYETLMLHNPTVSQRTSLKTNTHIWKYGDRYYKLANQYYGDSRLWWVIAWYNARPTEANIQTGDVIAIPLSIQDILTVLRI
jgi:nucleoid-associated protein YgaU